MKQKTQLVSTTELMRTFDIKSYNTVQRLQDKGVLEPIYIGRNKKWDIQECLKIFKDGKN